MYKRYIRKGGNVYGPYFYESKRVSGRIVTNYVGAVEERTEKNRKYFLAGFFFIFLFAVILFFMSRGEINSPTGRAVFFVDNEYEYGEQVEGKLKFNLKKGELIPKDTIVRVLIGREKKDIPLRELINEEELAFEALISGLPGHDSYGDFFAEGSNVKGEGEGYGVTGERFVYPDVSFSLRVSGYREIIEEEIVSESGGGGGGGDGEGGGEVQVILCHVPPGNPDAATTITVGESAVSEHLGHGDYLGECAVREGGEGEVGGGEDKERKDKEKKDKDKGEGAPVTGGVVREDRDVGANREGAGGEEVGGDKVKEEKEDKKEEEKEDGTEQGKDKTEKDEKSDEEKGGEVKDGESEEDEVVLCHVLRRGKAKNERTIRVNAEDVNEHLRRGDYRGACKVDDTAEEDEKAVEESEERGNRVEFVSFIVEGKTSFGNDFVYELEDWQEAEIVSDSVRIKGKDVFDGVVSLGFSDNSARVSTKYSVSERGFGKEYLGDEVLELNVDLEKFELGAKGRNLRVLLMYNGAELLSFERGLLVDIADEELVLKSGLSLIEDIPLIKIAPDSSVGIDLSKYFAGAERYEFKVKDIEVEFAGDKMILTPNVEFSGARKGKVIAYSGEEKLKSNEFGILVSSGAISISTSREKIRVGERVKWKKEVSLENPEKVSVELPLEAEEISVKEVVDGVEGDASVVTGSVILGDVSLNVDLYNEPRIIKKTKIFFKKLFSGLTGRAVTEDGADSGNNFIEVVLEGDAKEYLIEYYTEAPKAFEEEERFGKRVVVSGPDGLEYSDVIAFTQLSNRIPIERADKIKVYWHNYDVVAEVKDVEEIPEEAIVGVEDSDEAVELERAEEVNELEKGGEGGADVASETGIVDEGVSDEVSGGEGVLGEESGDVADGTETAIDKKNRKDDRGRGVSGRAIDIDIPDENQGEVVVGGGEVSGESGEEGLEGDLQVGEGGEEIVDAGDGVILDENFDNVEFLENSETGGQYARQEVPFDAYDLDEDGKIDYIEWVVPHLSNQTFEIIEITKAEHLDENRSFISDIYEEVSALDGNWSEEINSSHYVRVTFEVNLTSDRDITVYARSNYSNMSIEVYEFNGSEIIASFGNILNDSKYKVYLDGSSGNGLSNKSQDVFDLKIVGENGSIEFDYIVDPLFGGANISFIAATLADGTNTTSTNIEINVSISNITSLDEIKFNWNRTNYTIYNDSLLVMYNFDNISALGDNLTTAVDVSSYSRNGTCWQSGYGVNCNWTVGKYGMAQGFNGTNQSVLSRTGDILGGSKSMSLTAWTRLAASDAGSIDDHIAAYSGGVLNIAVLAWATDEGFDFTFTNNSNNVFTADANSANTDVGVWHHLAGVYNGSNILLYVDGVLQTDKPNVTGPVSIVANSNFTVGAGRSGTSFYFNGTVDEVRLWNRSLTTAEVEEIYFSNLNKYNATQWYLYVNQSRNATAGLSEGPYTYFASAGDNSGNANQTETRTVTVDRTPPVITINAPANNTNFVNNRSILLNWTVGDNSNNNEMFVWASNDSTNLYDYLVYHRISQLNGTYTYNFSAQPFRSNADTALLLHFDNLSSYGENDTRIYDFSNSRLNASAKSSVWNETGRFAGAFEFNGVNSARNISIADPAAANYPLDLAQYTISLWFMRKGAGFRGGFAGCGVAGIEPLIAKGGGGGDGGGIDAAMTMGMNQTTVWGCSETMAGVDQVKGGTTVIQNNVWYHAVMTVNTTAMVTYINGVQDLLLALTAAPATNNNTLGIGTLYEGATNTVDGAWNGTIDEVVILNRSITASEVTQFYNLSLGRYYWRVNASDGAYKNSSGIYEFNLSSSVADTTPPNVTINSPSAGQNISTASVTVNVSLSVNGSVLYSFDGGVNNVSMTSTDELSKFGKLFNHTNSSIGDKTYTLSIYANDTAGNKNYSESREFTIDTTSPILIFESPRTLANGTQVNQSNVFIEVNIFDTNFRNITYSIFNSSGIVNNVTNQYRFSFDLRRYNRVINNSDLSLSVDSSDIAYNPVNNTLFVVHNTIGSESIQEIYPNGSLIRSITLTGFHDTEAIAYANTSGSTHRLIVGEEQRANLTAIFVDDSTTTFDIANGVKYDTSLGNLGNTGLEGVTYDSNRNVFYIVKEKTSKAIYQVNATGSSTAFKLFDAEGSLSGQQGTNLSDLSGVYYDNNTDTLFILSHESQVIANVYLNGTIIRNISVDHMTQPEGVTFIPFGDRLYVIGEADFYSTWHTTTNYTSYQNFTNLANGTYFYNATAYDYVGNLNGTGSRTVILGSAAVPDTIFPLISYGVDTETDGVNLSRNNIYVNVSVTETNEGTITFRVHNTTASVNVSLFTSGSVRTINWTGLADATYTFNVTVNDTAGNTNTTATRTVTVDRTLPTIQYVSPTDADAANVSRKSLLVNVTASDTNFGTIVVRLYNSSNSEINSSSSTTSPLFANFTNVANGGTYRFNATVNDTAGNTNSTATRIVQIDTDSPTASYVSPTENTGVFRSRNYIEINTTATDTNLQTLEIRLYNSTQNRIELNTSSTSPFYINYSGLSDGIYYYNASANDSAGNIANAATRNITLDRTNPLITIAQPQNTTYATTSLQINFTASDTNLGSCWYTNNSGSINNTLANCANTSYTASQGSTTITVYVNDSANNVNSSSVTFSVDSVFPETKYGSPTETDGSIINSNTIRVTVSASDTNLANITIRLYDSSKLEIRNNVSTTSPFNINYSGLSDGIYYFNATGRDTFSNQNNTDTRNVTIDTTVPLISYGVGTETDGLNTTRNNIYVNVTVTETNEGTITFRVHNATASVNVSSFTSGSVRTINWTGLADATYTFNVTVNDTAGNTNTTATRTVTVDRTNPLISYGVGTETDGVNLSRNNIYVNVTVTETNEGTITFRVHNATASVNVSSFTSGSVRTINWTGLADATYTFNVTVNDTAGNTNTTATRTTTVDRAPPIVFDANISHPVSGRNYSDVIGTVIINVSVVDALTSVNAVFFNVTNSSGVQNTTLTASVTVGENLWKATLNTTHFPDGVYNITVFANDSVGNVNNSARVHTIRFDNTVPSVSTPVSPASGSNFSRTFVFNVSITDVTTSIDKVILNVTNSSGAQNATITASNAAGNFWNATINTSHFPDGTYNITVLANDSVGNLNSSVRVSAVKFDNSAPVITINDPANSTYAVASINFNVTLNEDGDSCSYSLNSGAANITMQKNGLRNFNASNSSIGDASYTANYYCNDTVGNLNGTARVTFTVDAVAEKSVGAGGAGASTSSESGGGAGGAVAVEAAVSGLRITPDELSISVISGIREVREIRIVNPGTSNVNLRIEVEGEIEDVLSLEGRIRLGSGEERVLQLRVNALDNRGLLTGKIVFRSGSYEKEVLVVINVRSSNFLFDVSVDLPEDARTVRVGDDTLTSQINLLQVGDNERVDVTARYVIKDFEGNVYLEESETFFVLGARDYIKELPIFDLPPGKYILGLEIIYPNAYATSSAVFEVGEEALFSPEDILKNKTLLILIGVVLVVIFVLIIFFLWRIFRRNKKKKKAIGRN